MPSAYRYQPTNATGSEDEDDLNLDEFDYNDEATNGHSASKTSPWPERKGDGSIPLRSLPERSPGRFWGRRKRQDDLEELLVDTDEDAQPWNEARSKRRSFRRRRASSRRASVAQSLQFTDLVRQEIADSREKPQADNQNSRTIQVGSPTKRKFPPNAISNAKYAIWSFLPLTLYNEFKFFLNIYFLLVALSQIVPFLRIGYMSTYIVPLVFVLTISVGKEALDDVARRRRDAEANGELYTVLQFGQDKAAPEVLRRSRDLKVGDVLKLEKDQRMPADVVILKSIQNDDELEKEVERGISAVPAETFIRTDQLDGETDWKLRIPCVLSQQLDLASLQSLTIEAQAPNQKLNEFAGTVSLLDAAKEYDPHISSAEREVDSSNRSDSTRAKTIPLSLDNTAWANTVLASNTTTYAVIVYTGPQTRSAMSASSSRSKVGLLEAEINNLTKILCFITLALSIVLVALEGFEPSNNKKWYVAIMIYLILFSTIIPISLRVNLDMAKTVHAYFIEHDSSIPNTLVRTSTIPEDLGRIEYLLTDKTGTLTQNEMQLKKIHIGTVSFAGEAMEDIHTLVNQAFGHDACEKELKSNGTPTVKNRRELGDRVRDLIIALAFCHNVTPSTETIEDEQITTYQASSPDEIAIVEFAESVGLRLHHRTRDKIVLQSTSTNKMVLTAQILDIFPFTSDSKRMGIIVKMSSHVPDFSAHDSIVFYQKGADTVMSPLVSTNDWLDEETSNMAREGLRTLVVASKQLSQDQYAAFSAAHHSATLSLHNRDKQISSVMKTHLEHDLVLLGVTGVEDRLQPSVKSSLELLRNAGIKIWMLTGDKPETARCVAISSRLVSRHQPIYTISAARTPSQVTDHLTTLQSQSNTALLIDGDSLSLVLSSSTLTTQFIAVSLALPAIIACRCSPIQKATLATLLRTHTPKTSRVLSIGDGGNDVPMIQSADVGIGIVGKEGRQASLAADYSVVQFSHITKLLVWHGRNSYTRSSKLALFIIHRGLIFAVCQTVYSVAGHFDPKGLFKDWLLVGYATVYTMAPVFSLVLDRDVDERLANIYPELYAELARKGDGSGLSYRTFFSWVAVSVYQGVMIQGLSQLLVGAVDGPKMLSVAFTALVINELVMVAVSVTTWHWIMITCILGTAAIYAATVPFLGAYFDLGYVWSWAWVWRVTAVSCASLIPVWIGRLVGRKVKPRSWRKVKESY